MLLSQMNKYICCFMRVTHAINNIYKLIIFLELITIHKLFISRCQFTTYSYFQNLGISLHALLVLYGFCRHVKSLSRITHGYSYHCTASCMLLVISRLIIARSYRIRRSQYYTLVHIGSAFFYWIQCLRMNLHRDYHCGLVGVCRH